MKRINFIKSPLIIVIVAIVMIVQSLGCKKFLQVQPRDYMFEEEAFSTPKGVQSVLNGLYLSLSDSLLYGNMLTLNVTERMAQYYNKSTALSDNIPANEKALFSSIWKQDYSTILGVNNFCKKLQEPGFNVLPSEQRDVLLGEAIALRAFLHFDLLRMYGPVFSKSPDASAIPYVRKANLEIQPLLSARNVATQILLDLDTALTLLKNDPIRTKGVDRVSIPANGEGANVNFMSNRHRRMNYFAVKTLAARVLLYADKKAEAWETVNSILVAQQVFFPWQTEKEMGNDPIFSKEVFFGIDNRRIYDHYRQMFNPLLSESIIQTPKPARLDGIYNPASTDLRLKYWFKAGLEGNKSYKVFIKYSDATVKDLSIMYFQPLIKKSELYLIAAETAPDVEQGYAYLNDLRVNKGLPPLEYLPGSSGAELLSAIRDEYQREFIGEGQTFFMFKRFNLLQIPGMLGTNLINMTDAKYVPVLPEDESYYR